MTTMIDIDLMVFDFDGTLVQTARDIAGAVNYAMGVLGASPLEEEAIRGYIGDGVHNLIERALGPELSHLHARALDLFREYYDEHLLDTTVLYPGVSEMLEHFRDTKKIIVTNKMESFTLKIARGLAIDGCFDTVIGRDSGGPVKPDRHLLRPLLSRFAAPRDRTNRRRRARWKARNAVTLISQGGPGPVIPREARDSRVMASRQSSSSRMTSAILHNVSARFGLQEAASSGRRVMRTLFLRNRGSAFDESVTKDRFRAPRQARTSRRVVSSRGRM